MTSPRKILSDEAKRRLTMVFEKCQLQLLPSQTRTTYFITLNVLILKKPLLLFILLFYLRYFKRITDFCRNDVNSTTNLTRMIYVHVTTRVII